ncbi:Crp/Fnr family transcriptional regulator [Pseudomonas sp. GD04087]|uniref:Crp/Fnr family transcriptional regulator n=1 Tax=Pseudomonas TaxID=286 RepID=UPI001F285D47|nr:MULTISPECIES: Crp/Fnr family transcriptional regulator [Pseudomonas]MCP1648288.1 CRP-like cAMP-binding protein [Pseudomonas nitroreducens]MCP1686863.1 CRP-like cAMP-binding protein [Pseudomonas nitroreducens]MDH0288716.1 Crp/Fnr family transcriptional regulator [Pseudomonas sp. GD04087]MDH1050715.1 Crp/Fnr family transcriptional regulator [Pseudomonas sp. GD03903]MDH1999108.1 Crp/Fnr family transcriptional regulator [Pseudomonas sp. GD03691]
MTANTALNRAWLASLPPFANCSREEQDSILRQASILRLVNGVAVFEQGAPATCFYLLVHGRLKATQLTGDGQRVLVRVVNPGDLFGFVRALGLSDYPATAIASQDSLVLAWPTNQWEPLLARHPGFALNTVQAIGERLQEAHVRFCELATEEVERRVAHTVLRLVQQSGRPEADGIRIDFPVTRQDIAEMSGTTLHTVSRILSAWEDRGLVIGGRQKLLVRNPQQLMLVAGGSERDVAAENA